MQDIDGSILQTIKKLLGISPDDDAFDMDVIFAINSAFDRLSTLGIGPDEGFRIADDTAAWSDYLYDGKILDSVKTYVYFKTRLVFDPPTSSFVLESMNKQIAELEFLFIVKSDSVMVKNQEES